jgi:ethanolamine utilization protein EutQ (cupin superfamily)
MSRVKVFKDRERSYTPFAGEGWEIRMCREASTELSDDLGAGIAIYDRVRMPWTTHYNGYYFVVEGLLRVRVGDEVHECGAFDSIWIPKGVTAVFESDVRTKVVYSIYPVDWRDRAHD